MDATAKTVNTGKVDAPRAAQTNLRRTTDEIVGQVFYGTLLRQLRSSSLQGKYGHGGRGEEVFQAQLDQVLAMRAGQGSNTPIGQAILKRYTRRAEAMEAYRRQQQDALVRLGREARATDTGTAARKVAAEEVTAW